MHGKNENFDPRLKLIGMRGRANSRLKSDQTLAAPRSLLRHNEDAVGVNYWFTPRFVLKLSYHHVNGNLFSVPKLFDNAVQNNRLKKQTNVVVFGMQFSV